MKRSSSHPLLLGTFFLIAAGYLPFFPASLAQDKIDILDLDVASLLSSEVGTVSKTKQRVADTAAAVYILPGKDILKAGARSIPEALRLVPGLHVAQLSANSWAITARGLNGEFARNLLVLIDGRLVYNPSFGGVDWEMVDVFIEDVDRIEVVRGSGGAVWGANAVNGVINVITKKSSATEGGLATFGGGKEEKAFVGVRYGKKEGNSFAWRVYGKDRTVDGQKDGEGKELPEGHHQSLAGFRVDSRQDQSSKSVIQGEIFNGDYRQDRTIATVTSPYIEYLRRGTTFHGGYLRGEYSKSFSSEHSIDFRSYLNFTNRNFEYNREKIITWDNEVQHQFALSPSNFLVSGINFRVVSDDFLNNSQNLIAQPASHTYTLISGFFQDEQKLLSNSLSLIAGSKFEHNEFTGFEWQPTIRMVATPAENHRLWTAISRSVRVPSRLEEDFSIDVSTEPPTQEIPLPVRTTVSPNSYLAPEKLLGYEVGYRFQESVRFYFDLTAFYNRYSDLSSINQGPITQAFDTLSGLPYLRNQYYRGNSGKADIYGFEVLADWQAARWLKLQAWLSQLTIQINNASGTQDVTLGSVSQQNPAHQAALRAYLSLTDSWSLALIGRYLDSMPSYNIGAYLNMDARLQWAYNKNLEFALVGKDLFQDSRVEYQNLGLRAQRYEQIERRYFGQLTWKF